MVTPFSLPISAVRFSHSTASKGEVLPSVKYRLNTSPVFSPVALSAPSPVCSDLPCNAVLTVAIYSLRAPGLPPAEGGHPIIILLPFWRRRCSQSQRRRQLDSRVRRVTKQKIRPRLAVESGRKTGAKRNALPRAGVIVTTQPTQQRYYALHA